jgi:alpha-L-fucosidase
MKKLTAIFSSLFMLYTSATSQTSTVMPNGFPGLWGVFNHYLADGASANNTISLTVEQWNERVNAFDVNALAAQLATAGASYYFITIGQNSGYYCSPNSIYDSIVGRKHSGCSKRDLIADLAKALLVKGIKLGVYLPGGAPENDSIAVERFNWTKGNFRNKEFQQKWEAVIREWSQRWGENVFAWWIDGCYYPDAMYPTDAEPNFKTFARALKTGNPRAIVAFNPGIKPRLDLMTEYADYTAGEFDFNLPLIVPYYPPQKEKTTATAGGKQAHFLGFLGKWWGSGSARFSDELVIAYTKHITDNGGIITWDVPVSATGKIPEEFIHQLTLLKKIK